MEFKASTKKNRIEVVDALRGFALLGVLIANVPFSTAEAVQSAFDPSLNFLYHLLIDKKFISIFSMLFGFGFYIQMTRAAEKNIGFKSYFIKRMILLFIIGSIHCFVFWNGDIIMSYAVGGFLLLAIRKLSNKWLFVLAVFFNVILTGVIFIGNSALGWASYDYDFAIAVEQPLTQSLFRYLEINWITAPWNNFLNDMPLTLSFTFGNMLIGMLIGRTGFFLLPERFKKLTNWLIILGLTLGIASSYVLHLIFSGNLELDLPLLWVPFVIIAGMLLQSMAYISIFLRVYKSEVFRKKLSFFNPVGKTALTNYLMQSVFYLVVFFHCLPGFNLYENVTAGETYLIAFVFFGIQSWLSSQWLRRFDQGPFEYIWKKLSYKNLGGTKINQKTKEPKVKATLMIILLLAGVW